MFNTLSRSIQYGKTALKAKKLNSSTDVEKQIAEQYIAEKLFQMKGLAQKIGQTISLQELGKEHTNFGDLTEKKVTIEIEEIFRNFNYYHYDAKSIFKLIYRYGISASLSQVHRAVLRSDESDVAIKIQHKDIRSILNTDIRFLDSLLKPLGHFKKEFNIKSFQKELGEMAINELNYQKEAQMLEFFYNSDIPFLIVPKPYKTLSTNEVLVMEWVEGKTFNDVLSKWSTSQKEELSHHLLELFLKSLLELQKIHADPHSGNYRFRLDDNQVKIIFV